MFDKKTLPLVILLVLLVVFWFQIMEYLGFYTPPEKQTAQSPTQDTTEVTTEKSATDTTSFISPDTVTRKLTTLDTTLTEGVEPTQVETLTVVTNLYTVKLINQGGGPVSIKLRKHTYRDGEPIEMLPVASRATPEAVFAGGTVSTSDLRFTSSLSAGAYRAESDDLELTYSYQAVTGGEIIRRYRFYPNEYHYDLIIELRDAQQLGFERQYRLNWNTPLGVTEPQPDMDYQAMEAAAMMGGERTTLNNFEDGRLNQSVTGYTTWAGLRSKYFAAVLIPRDTVGDGAIAQGTKLKVGTPNGTVEQRLITVGIDLPIPSSTSLSDSFSVFVGPLDYTLLKKYGVNLEDMLGIGTTPFIGWIIQPFAIAIIWLLPKLYSAVPNYGLVIILFALMVKVVTLPLSMKSFKSMNAMKELQPEMEKLKEKLKKNPQQLQQETMKLYKKHGVNPMSGCLPMLAQMPLFFALFSVFRSTILLRDAPFVWFITDLSRGASGLTDPYIILVILMVATQFISQRFTMASTTQQNKIFQFIFPIMMGFFLYRFPAGLVLYWTCFSLFSLIDYFLFKRNKQKNLHIQTT